MSEQMNKGVSTKDDITEFQIQANEVKNKDGIIKYKNFLLLNYLYAVQRGDHELKKYTRRNLLKAYCQLGFDDNAKYADVQRGLQWLRELLSKHKMEMEMVT